MWAYLLKVINFKATLKLYIKAYCSFIIKNRVSLIFKVIMRWGLNNLNPKAHEAASAPNLKRESTPTHLPTKMVNMRAFYKSAPQNCNQPIFVLSNFFRIYIFPRAKWLRTQDWPRAHARLHPPPTLAFGGFGHALLLCPPPSPYSLYPCQALLID